MQSVTLAELREKYDLSESAKYEPKLDCRHCGGAGERVVSGGKTMFCICLFVEHNASDEIGSMLGEAARETLREIRMEKKNVRKRKRGRIRGW